MIEIKGNSPEAIVEKLRGDSYRITKAREDIIKLLCDVRHYTVDELVTELKKIKGDVNVATVYNNVNFLVGEGIVSEYNFNNRASVFYELNIGLHAHLICVDCNGIINVDITDFVKLKNKVEKEHEFKVVDAKLDLYGKCTECMKSKIQ